ncbi:MAG: polymer-forming cytoskeletal protein [Myxococcota bacterium]
MAFGRDRLTEMGDVSSTEARPPTSGGLTAFIDQGSEFEGKLSFKDTVRIDGHFKGEIGSENTLIVGESGEVEANIKSKTVVVSGCVTGDVMATRQLVVHKTGRLQGNVQTASLVIEEGAILNGQIQMSRPEPGAPRAGQAIARPNRPSPKPTS